MGEPNLDNTSIFLTGGTGSFGKAFVQYVVDRWTPKRLVIFSRDELKQFEMAQRFSDTKYPFIRYFIGDIRDAERVKRAMEGCDTVVHAAALKQVPAAEYNPFECIKTNVIGAQNLIEACLDGGVRRVVALSTDKAAAPVNLYGATKLCSDKLFVAANNMRGSRDLHLSVVRYGNVMGSRGSVIPFFLSRRDDRTLPITDLEMTRFNISLDDGVKMVMWALANSKGGEIFVPKIPSYRVTDVAKAVAPDAEHDVIGIRPGEKVHEEMITVSDSQNTVDLGPYYAILPSGNPQAIAAYCSDNGAKQVVNGFCYDSGANDDFLSVEQIRQLIREHVDPDFSIGQANGNHTL